ncbi:hypothetical protein CDL15_Pgr017240 [Punica granatum]|uniref:Uncharacterized protein n=1 Tax=Punica granatum TaxID=22663 RepID=A0A218WQI1_PUNGR|nr:hypothetical protein CDL15_Pgr017240 [Punica granatum]
MRPVQGALLKTSGLEMRRRGARVRREYACRNGRQRSMCWRWLRKSRNWWVDFLGDVNSVFFRHSETLMSRITVRRQL